MLYIEFKLPYLKPNHYVICCFTYLGLEEKKRIDNNLAKKGQNEVTEHRLGIPEELVLKFRSVNNIVTAPLALISSLT